MRSHVHTAAKTCWQRTRLVHMLVCHKRPKAWCNLLGVGRLQRGLVIKDGAEKPPNIHYLRPAAATEHHPVWH